MDGKSRPSYKKSASAVFEVRPQPLAFLENGDLILPLGPCPCGRFPTEHIGSGHAAGHGRSGGFFRTAGPETGPAFFRGFAPRSPRPFVGLILAAGAARMFADGFAHGNLQNRPSAVGRRCRLRDMAAFPEDRRHPSASTSPRAPPPAPSRMTARRHGRNASALCSPTPFTSNIASSVFGARRRRRAGWASAKMTYAAGDAQSHQ